MNLILCGLPTSGKTTVGKKLAQQLNWDFTDTDRLIENAYALQTGKVCTCCQICLQEGEPFFRRLEDQQIASLQGLDQNIIAVGGGSLCNWDNTKTLQLLGSFIYLKADPRTLWKRIQSREMLSYLDPHSPEKSFYEIAERRIPLYEKIAHAIIDTSDLDEQRVASKIITLYFTEL